MYRKSVLRRHYERKLAKCAAMRAAKERKRMERASALMDVGGFVTDGCLGQHIVRLFASEAWDDHVAVMVDGQCRRARTMRGVVRCLALMVWNKAKPRQRRIIGG